ncbi:cytochrome P450 [Halobaculum sp. CBA1158]|uniref:cytochrome P450 n=1 Tax=Halobaculum sp. CBA1158 TaxID=2904243 RepID=UPI001F3C0A3E|nr:cytochrome P450 [Halobaculum sp. CBA1158]UIO99022.1 cytochrome P450 [Halobaculum sp. CBA1158]
MSDTQGSPLPPEAAPGPDGLPVVGSFLESRCDFFAFRDRVAREHGGVARYEILGQSVFLLTDPDAIRRVLVGENERYEKGELFQQQLRPVLGNGLLNSEGEFWRRQRHLIQPAFTPDRIAGYGDMMVEATERTSARWDDGEVRDVHRDMMGLTLDIVARALAGVDIRDRTPAIGGALDTVMEQSAGGALVDLLPAWVPTPGRQALDEAVSSLDRIVDELIVEKRRALRAGEVESDDDVVAALLTATDEDGEHMADEQVRDEVKTLLLAGHETTALALTFTLHLLARHPDVEETLLAELESELGDEPAGVDSVRDLEYLDDVITESMRLLPPVHGILREPTEDVELGGYRIPEGTPLAISQWVVHRDPAHYDDPLEFRPERWTDEMEADLHPLAYFPFSSGPRRCVGDRFALLEAKLILATLLRRYAFEVVEPVDLEGCLEASITTRPTEPVRMRVRDR